MKHLIFMIFILSQFMACSSDQEITGSSTRKFLISETDNAAAWSRANVAIFNRAYDHLVTTTDFSVSTYYDICYVTRAKYGNQYEYTVVGRGNGEAIEIECEIRNIKNCDPAIMDKNKYDAYINKSQIEAQEKNRAKATKLPNGTIIYE